MSPSCWVCFLGWQLSSCWPGFEIVLSTSSAGNWWISTSSRPGSGRWLTGMSSWKRDHHSQILQYSFRISQLRVLPALFDPWMGGLSKSHQLTIAYHRVRCLALSHSWYTLHWDHSASWLFQPAMLLTWSSDCCLCLMTPEYKYNSCGCVRHGELKTKSNHNPAQRNGGNGTSTTNYWRWQNR